MNQIVITNAITNRDNTLCCYLSDIKKYAVLTASQQNNLARIMRNGGKQGADARRQLIECNLRFAVSVAKKYENGGIPLLDLINDANIGLCRACDKFDASRGINFISYAVNYMQCEILADFEKHGRHIRLPHDVHALVGEYNRLVEQLLTTEQRMPTIDEFAEHTNISYSKAAHIFESMGAVDSIDAPVSSSTEDMTLADVLFVENSTSDYLESQYDRSAIDSTLREVLKEDEYRIVQAVYGLLGDNGPSVTSLSCELGISADTLRKRCSRSIKKIRQCPKAMDEFRQLLAA